MLVLYGPTVTGKTDLAIKLAKKYNGELISADSRQVYKGLDIGSGKVSFDAKYEKHDSYWIVNGIKIYGFDICEPNTQFTASDFLKYTEKTSNKITKLGKKLIIVGGTGFYIKSYIEGLDSLGIPVNKKLRSELEKLSLKILQSNLQQENKKKFDSMNNSDKSNPRRLIRAIEIAKSKELESRNKNQRNRPLVIGDYLLIGLTAPNSYLYKKADKWLEERFEKGLIAEVSSLIENGAKHEWLIGLGLEYKWVTKFLLKEINIVQTKKNLKNGIHNLIKRQKTFYNQFPQAQLFDISQKNYSYQLEKTVRSWYNRENG